MSVMNTAFSSILVQLWGISSEEMAINVQLWGINVQKCPISSYKCAEKGYFFRKKAYFFGKMPKMGAKHPKNTPILTFISSEEMGYNCTIIAINVQK